MAALLLLGVLYDTVYNIGHVVCLVKMKRVIAV